MSELLRQTINQTKHTSGDGCKIGLSLIYNIKTIELEVNPICQFCWWCRVCGVTIRLNTFKHASLSLPTLHCEMLVAVRAFEIHYSVTRTFLQVKNRLNSHLTKNFMFCVGHLLHWRIQRAELSWLMLLNCSKAVTMFICNCLLRNLSGFWKSLKV